MNKNKDYYQLEKNIIKNKQRIEKLEAEKDPENKKEIKEIKSQIEKEWEQIKPKLTPFNIVQIARHQMRPNTLDYIDHLTEDFLEFHGDRRFRDDPAIIAGFGFYKKKSVAIIGHQKGRTTRQRLKRNFGQPNPEGYRKALRIMRLAEKFNTPIFTFIDTQGAYPGIEAEERGQAEAIAFNLHEISKLKIPVLNIIIGEGGSGGALGIGVGDIYLMLENAYYSVISPEGCAAILWKDQSAVNKAVENLKICAPDLLKLKIIDKIIPEPPGGAHIDWEQTFKNVDKELNKTLQNLEQISADERLEKRYNKFRKIGEFIEK
ncbi:MAG: acetyl-CoA carboxylase carboxyltransferase subunit alpha [Candidatus Aminicenantaceae bacterium]